MLFRAMTPRRGTGAMILSTNTIVNVTQSSKRLIENVRSMAAKSACFIVRGQDFSLLRKQLGKPDALGCGSICQVRVLTY